MKVKYRTHLENRDDREGLDVQLVHIIHTGNVVDPDIGVGILAQRTIVV